MTRNLFIGLGFLLALTGTAAAAPALRAEVTVRSRDRHRRRHVRRRRHPRRGGPVPRPAPGTTGIVSSRPCARPRALVGLTDFEAEGIERVRVARAAAVVDAEFLTHLITADLAAARHRRRRT